MIATGGTGGRVGSVPVARQVPLAGGWLGDAASSASRWIVISSGQGSEGTSVETGSFPFQTTVDLTGYNPTTAFLDTLRYAADNKLAAIPVNGTSVFSQGTAPEEEFGSFLPLPATHGQGLFVSGVNTVTLVLNTPPPPDLATTPVGFRLEGSVSATVPEPTACMALALPEALRALAAVSGAASPNPQHPWTLLGIQCGRPRRIGPKANCAWRNDVIRLLATTDVPAGL